MFSKEISHTDTKAAFI